MTLETIEVKTSDSPRASIIVLHGLGADGHDFVPLCRELDLAALGPLRLIFPHAPERPVTINGGYRMRAWYDLKEVDLQRREDEAGVRASAVDIAALIDAERARGVPSERIVLMGFSQGCAMSLFTGLRYPHRLAGLVGLSGYQPLAESLAAELAPANAGLPIFLAHGRQDPVVQIARGEAALEQLRGLGYAPSWHAYDMEHSVCAEELADLDAWLIERLG